MKNNTMGSLIWFRAARFTHQSALLSNEFLKQYDITLAQFDILNQIYSHQPISQSKLAIKATISQGGISRMLTRLEKENLIERKQDWKTKWISLTDLGEKKLAEVFDKQLAFQTNLVDAALSQSEQKDLYNLLSKLQKSIEEKVIHNKS